MKEETGWCICISVVAVIVLTGTLIGLSVKKVEHDEFALETNGYDPTLKEKIYEEGRRMLKPDSHLVKFNRKFVSVEFVDPTQIVCWTFDGLQMELTIKTQYQIIKEQLYGLVSDEFRNEKKFQKYLTPLIAGSFMDSCSNFTAQDYFEKRGVIDAFLFDQLKQDVLNAHAHVTIGFVQLEIAQHPDSFVTAVTNKQVAQQDVEKAQNERDEILINAETRLLEAEQEALILVNQAKADSSAVVFAAAEQAEANFKFWEERTIAFENIMVGLSYDADQFINDYLTAQVIQGAERPIVQL